MILKQGQGHQTWYTWIKNKFEPTCNFGWSNLKPVSHQKRNRPLVAACFVTTTVMTNPHQDQIFYNSTALCLAVWAKNQIQLLGGGGLIHPTDNTPPHPQLDLLCLRFSRSKYNASKWIICLCFFLTLWPKKKTHKNKLYADYYFILNSI